MQHRHQVVGEVGSLLAIAGAFEHILPSIATLLAIGWYGCMIAESRFLRRLWNRNREVAAQVKTALDKPNPVEAAQAVLRKDKAEHELAYLILGLVAGAVVMALVAFEGWPP